MRRSKVLIAFAFMAIVGGISAMVPAKSEAMPVTCWVLQTGWEASRDPGDNAPVNCPKYTETCTDGRQVWTRGYWTDYNNCVLQPYPGQWY